MTDIESMGTRISIGDAIRAARLKEGLTVRDLAAECGLAANHISRIETGKYNYTIDTLFQVLNALGLKLYIY